MTHHPVYESFKPVPATASGQHIYDFLGAATRVAFKRAWLSYAIKEGKQYQATLPVQNEHYLDWVATLEAVHRAAGTFRMAELGAGWGPWLVRGAIAARQRPQITGIELLAVEADPVHHGWVRDHFADNGIDPDAHAILFGAVSDKPGTLRFPRIGNPDEDYGASVRAVGRDKPYIEVPAITIDDILQRFSGPLDFMHVDIQGAEYDVLPPAMAALKRGVKSIMVGTHISDAMHNELVGRFVAEGWKTIYNFPRNTTSPTPFGEIAFNDGFLLFGNPSFR